METELELVKSLTQILTKLMACLQSSSMDEIKRAANGQFGAGGPGGAKGAHMKAKREAEKKANEARFGEGSKAHGEKAEATARAEKAAKTKEANTKAKFAEQEKKQAVNAEFNKNLKV